MRLLIGALALCGACGGNNATVDASVTIDTPATSDDAPPDGSRQPTCAASTFKTSSGVTGVNTSAPETLLRMSPDELTAYFARQEPDEVLYVATRVSTTAPFSTPVKLPINGNSTNETTSATVTADGLTLYFTSNRTGGKGGRDIYRATRSATTATFGNITAVTELNTTSSENDAFVLPDHSAIYFSSNISGEYRIYRAVRQGAGFASADEVMSDIGGAHHVVVTADELTMLYTTSDDLRLSVRATTTVSWLPGVALADIDSAQIDNPTWISPDLCRMYFQTTRTGNYELRVAVRTPE